jgi:hypothetical protein
LFVREELMATEGASSLYEPLGGFRQKVHPFTDKQIALVTSFASQAVIAIENARLLNELRQSLEQQTATAEVLKVVSSSPGELQPVFAAMLENATRICDAAFGNIARWDGETVQVVATHNTPPAFAEARKRPPYRPEPFELPPGQTSLSFLQKIYRSPRQPIVRRMRAAALALPFESPKPAVTAVLGDEASFAAMLDRAIARSQAPPKMIELRPDETSPSVKWKGPLRDGG